METVTVTIETKKDRTYNGWPNYQTWNVMLWMDNEESCYRAYREKVQRYADKGKRFGSFAAQQICIDCLGERTPDGVKVASRLIKWAAIAEAMKEN